MRRHINFSGNKTHTHFPLCSRAPVRVPDSQLRFEPSREIEVPMYDVTVKKIVVVDDDDCHHFLSDFLGGEWTRSSCFKQQIS